MAAIDLQSYNAQVDSSFNHSNLEAFQIRIIWYGDGRPEIHPYAATYSEESSSGKSPRCLDWTSGGAWKKKAKKVYYGERVTRTTELRNLVGGFQHLSPIPHPLEWGASRAGRSIISPCWALAVKGGQLFTGLTGLKLQIQRLLCRRMDEASADSGVPPFGKAVCLRIRVHVVSVLFALQLSSYHPRTLAANARRILPSGTAKSPIFSKACGDIGCHACIDYAKEHACRSSERLPLRVIVPSQPDKVLGLSRDERGRPSHQPRSDQLIKTGAKLTVVSQYHDHWKKVIRLTTFVCALEYTCPPSYLAWGNAKVYAPLDPTDISALLTKKRAPDELNTINHGTGIKCNATVHARTVVEVHTSKYNTYKCNQVITTSAGEMDRYLMLEGRPGTVIHSSWPGTAKAHLFVGGMAAPLRAAPCPTN
ncbi:hypothetical protein FHL15_000538 [Xylaria flabelliformis]|uniref:Uncharacterized protein n=1 Tax=Xylaria flabelliformis TaxID=2512241 RepID=A0A553IE46_9PEZI|nr:hypothetical protein FHL15_000538 [Xylaria flabelliformis]